MNETLNQFEEFENLDDFSTLDIKNLILEIWTKPMLVFKYLFKTNAQKYVWPLMIIGGLTSALDKALDQTPSFDTYGIGYFLGVLIAGGLLGWISYYISAWFFYISGSIFLNGTAKAKEFRTVVAWGSIPSIASIFIPLLISSLYGESINTGNLDEIEYIIIVVLSIIKLGLLLWSFVLMVYGTMHIQNFGAGKAILNLFIPLLIAILLILALYLIINL